MSIAGGNRLDFQHNTSNRYLGGSKSLAHLPRITETVPIGALASVLFCDVDVLNESFSFHVRLDFILAAWN